LIDVFAKMIFMYGHVHCDAHPGNMLVRPNPNGELIKDEESGKMVPRP
jgi:predicted unusual protein kinase regulating ubiquinone biosynthesis (AarF/ABC1/UbiB family)